MDKIINKNKVPKLRFGEFNNEWHRYKIKDTLKIKSGRDQKSIIDENGNNPILGTGGIIGKTNSFLYDKPSVLIGRKGTINKPQYMDTPFWTVDTLFYSEIHKEFFPKFIYYVFQNINWKKYDESTGVPSLTASTIENIKYYIPNLKEQQKIANFFTLIDKKINLQTQKVELLKMYEKKFIKNLLNSNNKDWKNVTLKDCCLGFDHLRKPIISTQRKTGNIPYYGANGIQDYINDFLFDGEYILLAEDGGHFDEFFCKPIAQYINGKAWVNNHAHVIQGNNENCTKFLYYCLKHKDIRQYVNGASRAKLNQDNMWKIRLKLPPLNKQIQISDTLSIFDKKILIQEKLKKRLEDFKKCLLQQMFI